MLARCMVRGVGGLGVAIIAIACATGEVDDEDFEGELPGEVTSDAAPPRDVVLPPTDAGDSGEGPPGTGEADSGGAMTDAGDAPCTGAVVINELMPNGVEGGSSNVEFIELYNPTGCAVSLTGWRLRYRASSGNAGPDIYAFVAGDTIPKHGFFVIAKDNFKGKKDRAFTTAGGLGNSGGQVGLLDASDALVDAVGYGPSSGAFTEGNPAPLPPEGSSLGRKSDGVDSNDNRADFKVFAAHSAGAPN